jgi:hypothetical protein
MMPWLVLAFALQLGYTPDATMLMYQPTFSPPNAMEEELVDFDFEARLFNFIYVGGNMAAPMWHTVGLSFWPNELQSEVRAGIRIGDIEVGWSHICTHPVIPYAARTQILWEGWYDEFHIKISGEVHP